MKTNPLYWYAKRIILMSILLLGMNEPMYAAAEGKKQQDSS